MQSLFKFQYDPKWQTVKFEQPTKKIIHFEDVQTFQKKHIHYQYIQFLTKLQKSIAGKKISQTKYISKFEPFQQYFKQLQQFLDDFPPIQQPMRYGNKAFKDWYVRAAQYTKLFLDLLIPQQISGCKPQLYRYIVQSFGSNVRIDYGTGHELSYMFFCWSLYRLGFCEENQFQQLVRQVFYKYVNTMRKVQLRYMLEPAGSHGVWGLDDYVFLPFYLGLRNYWETKSLHRLSVYIKHQLFKITVMNTFKKNVSFAESSPILNNISGAANWEKITGGMIKMYKAQVLGKHPVIKHQFFGTIIPYQ